MPKVYAQATHIQTDIRTQALGPFETDQEAWEAVARAEGRALTWERTKRGHMVSTETTRWVTETQFRSPEGVSCSED
ncbi:hypothetical protein [Deinococcus sp. Leaf326]|jgi:hypothetical protein|uniref:hypothetical protein n=1 Tax=Deinococcus sp. Leaf326 TaxID=1736338 RepID=UPI000713CF4F|nr:hypothetical protein [Deinococcus sp. Leaf326]KQR01068.1 hypothetical protein ASF71_13010 [Deinococcus sp. Leaf326]